MSAALVSAIIPGAGHFLLKRRSKAMLLLGLFLSTFLIYWPLRLPRISIYALTMAATLRITLAVYSAWDAAYSRQSPIRPSRWWLAMLLPIALFFGSEHGDWMLRASGFQAYSIPSSSMYPTVKQGEGILVDNWYYRHSSPKRGDIIVYNPPQHPTLFTLKRVVAVGGDTIESSQNIVKVNGKPLEEAYALHEGNADEWMRTFAAIKIPGGQLFVMGDNRDNSLDSRAEGYGPVYVNAVRGKMIWAISPPKWWPKHKEN